MAGANRNAIVGRQMGGTIRLQVCAPGPGRGAPLENPE
jgi:hypothetical protein